MSPSKLSPESDVFSKSLNLLKGIHKVATVLAIGVGVAGLTACANAEGPKPTPTETSVVETEPPVPAPEMKPYILTSGQLDDFMSYMESTTEDDAFSTMNSYARVIGETLIPATQAYIDNLMLNRDDLASVDTSSITDNPNSPIVSRLMSLVQTQAGDPKLHTKFYVCSIDKETTPEICSQPGRSYTDIFNGARPELGIVSDRNTLSIVKVTNNDPFGAKEDNNIEILIGNGQVVGLTDKDQIIYK